MAPDLRFLRRAPFHLDARAVRWVAQTFAALDDEQKLAQTLIVQGLELDRENLDRFVQLGVGGVFPRWDAHAPGALRNAAGYLQRHSAVPVLLCGDLEFGALGPIGREAGTEFPNQLAVAATGDPRWAARMAEVAARSGRSAGLNWSFSPVADLCLNFRSTITGTRSFGDRPALTARMVAAYIRAMQAQGMAACAKHWPGDGCDDRDQHLVTSVNDLALPAWEASFGRVFRAAIRAGVLTVMSSHIALPAWRGAGGTPASLSRRLNLDLLRRRLGCNGLIVSDASNMAGLTSRAPRRDCVPQLLAGGCDMILFPRDVELDLGWLRAALRDGRLPRRRLDEAVLRVLGLKAALGLHRPRRPARPLSAGRQRRHARWAATCAARAITLVQDAPKLLPLDPRRHRRLLLLEQPPRRLPFGWTSKFQLDARLRAAGFHVERFEADLEVHRDYFDLVLYAVAEEAFLGRGAIELRWPELHANFGRCLERYWHDVPTVFVSFGSPFHLREMPACPTFLNAYSPIAAMQQAVVDALVGRTPFNGRSPVNLRPYFAESVVI